MVKLTYHLHKQINYFFWGGGGGWVRSYFKAHIWQLYMNFELIPLGPLLLDLGDACSSCFTKTSTQFCFSEGLLPIQLCMYISGSKKKSILNSKKLIWDAQ